MLNTFHDNLTRWGPTYLRCYYKVHNDALQMDSDYKWAVNNDGSYYKLYGFEVINKTLSMTGMFYTETRNKEMQSVCAETLKKDKINHPVSMISAADNSSSFNQEIWSFYQPAAHKKFERIIAFGDSLSDTGNMYNASLWSMPNRKNWFLGRFTDGKVWVEYLSENLDTPLHNWATGGAGADEYKHMIPGVLQQTESWKDYISHDFGYAADKTLFTMLIGGNDIVQYNISVDSIIKHQKQALETLIKNGAKNILVLNLPDVSKAPIFSVRTDSQKISNEVLDYNKRIMNVVETIKTEYGSSINIKLFDLFSLFNDLRSQPQKYGFRVVDQSCLNMNSIEPPAFSANPAVRPECTNPKEYLFWDTLHPTTAAHKKLADFVTQFINASFH